MNPLLLGVLVFIYSAYQMALVLQLKYLRQELADLRYTIMISAEHLRKEDLP